MTTWSYRKSDGESRYLIRKVVKLFFLFFWKHAFTLHFSCSKARAALLKVSLVLDIQTGEFSHILKNCWRLLNCMTRDLQSLWHRHSALAWSWIYSFYFKKCLHFSIFFRTQCLYIWNVKGCAVQARNADTFWYFFTVMLKKRKEKQKMWKFSRYESSND